MKTRSNREMYVENLQNLSNMNYERIFLFRKLSQLQQLNVSMYRTNF